ncbi:MAG TPA: calcium-binding protein, partial [Nitrospiraceae bacterium]
PAQVENLALTGTGSISGTGNALNNIIVGNAASNVLDGGAGNDVLNGEEGADVFLFALGLGQDIVADETVAGDIDTIQIAAGVTASQLGVAQRGSDLVLNIAGTTDEMVLANFYAFPEASFKQVRFADGTVWDSTTLQTLASPSGVTLNGGIADEALTGGIGNDSIVGNAGNDTLTGGLGSDVIFGDATSDSPFSPVIGNDILVGGPGDDVLTDFQGTNVFDGGPGNDSLRLGAGQDTILFGRGSGNDVVQFDGNGSDVDLVQMAADLSPADVQMTRQYPNTNILKLTIRDTGETLTLNLSTNYPSVDPSANQGKVLFADGSQWNLSWVPADPNLGTTGDDVLVASFPGNLTGLSGDDTYVIGSYGVPGTYVVVEAPDGGIDTVQSIDSYTLDANVENLYLLESNSSAIPKAERGTGNGLDNLIIGNAADNILDGGAGNDVLVGGLFRSAESRFVDETGSDILIGGAGDDIFMADGGNFVIPRDRDGAARFRQNVPRAADDLFIGGTGND